MKKLCFFLMLIIIFAGCSEESAAPSSGTIELVAGDGNGTSSKRVSGSISEVGEVDLYSTQVNTANRVVQIRCSSETVRPTVDLLVHVFERKDGELVMIAGDHHPDGANNSADILINIFIDEPKELFIHVRDYNDNESSDHPYYISVDYENSPGDDDNSTFEDAIPLTIDSSESITDRIDYIGDIDCFGFRVETAGVYNVRLLYAPGNDTSVRLSVDLFRNDEDSSVKIDERTPGDALTTHLVHYLLPGNYTLVVDDVGRDHFDRGSIYTVNINSLSGVDEMKVNDQITDAQELPDESIAGSLDYYEDQDWYKLDVTPVGNGFNVLALNFVSPELDGRLQYQINLYKVSDSELNEFDLNSSNPVFSHDVNAGNSLSGPNEFTTAIKLDDLTDGENYYLLVKPVDPAMIVGATPYVLNVQNQTIIDLDEGEGDGNDTNGTADILPRDVTEQGKISFMGDKDWYIASVGSSNTERVMSVYLDTTMVSPVEYTLYISRNDDNVTLEKRLFNMRASTTLTHLRTSFIVPKGSVGDYYFTVMDFTDNDGADVEYSINWTLVDIPGNPGVPVEVTTPLSVTGPVYYSDEKKEFNGEDDYNTPDISLFLNRSQHKLFKVNDAVLAHSNANVVTDAVTGVKTITYPWITGYIDYMGDEDWFMLPIISLNDADTTWTYEFQVEFYAKASDVEHTWRYFIDRNRNHRVDFSHFTDNENDNDTVWACGGDSTVDVADTVNLTTTSGDEIFCINSRTGDRDTYFSISDFNYLYEGYNEDGSRIIRTTPEDDWDKLFEAPYYFRLTMVYTPSIVCD